MAYRQWSHTVARLDACPHAYWYPEAPPCVGDEVWCHRCSAYRRVVEVRAEYVVSCDATNCRQRRFGAALLEAQRYADKHHREHPTHNLILLQGTKVVEERRANAGQGVLGLSLYDAPF